MYTTENTGRKLNILLTGSSGFIGTNFIRMSSEYNVRELDLISTKPEKKDFRFVDIVVHLAGLAHQKGNIPEMNYFLVNRDLSLLIAKMAKENGVPQFIYMSSSKVYGDFANENEVFNEDSKCSPGSAYGRSKLEAEKLLLELVSESFNVAIIRSPLVYGPGVKANMLMLMKFARRMPFLPFGKIGNKRSMVYIGNLVGLIKAIISKKTSGVFIAGDKEPLSSTFLIDCICKQLGKKRIFFTMPKIFIKFLKRFKPNMYNQLYV